MLLESIEKVVIEKYELSAFKHHIARAHTIPIIICVIILFAVIKMLNPRNFDLRITRSIPPFNSRIFEKLNELYL